MIKKYALYFLFLIVCFGLNIQDANAQLRIVEVDPAQETATIKNFGSTTIDISSYRLCALFKYGSLGSMTVQEGSLNLVASAEVVVTVALSGGSVLNDAGSDLGLYLPTGSFGLAANMIDFVQWGSSPNGRESVAVTKGIWTAGTFVNVSAPYEFTGGASDSGVAFWDTLLNVGEVDDITKFEISPNPASLNLNITIPNSIENAELKVFDLLGKRVLERDLSNVYSISIDVSKWNSGVYIVRVSSDDITQTKRFIKQ